MVNKKKNEECLKLRKDQIIVDKDIVMLNISSTDLYDLYCLITEAKNNDAANLAYGANEEGDFFGFHHIEEEIYKELYRHKIMNEGD